MTKKDFELIAKVINGLNVDFGTRMRIAQSFNHELAMTNARFNQAKFVDACMKDHHPTREPNDE